LYASFAKETWHFGEATNRCHPINSTRESKKKKNSRAIYQSNGRVIYESNGYTRATLYPEQGRSDLKYFIP